MNTLPTAAGFFLVLAAGAFAAPITSDNNGGGLGGYWAMSATSAPWEYGGAFHSAHRSHGLDMRALWSQYQHRNHASLQAFWAPARLDEEYPVRSWLCGGEPGAGFSQYPSEGPVPETPEVDESHPGDEGSETHLSASEDPDRGANPIPAVPEPGSLAMLGAGALGLLAARGLLKDR